MARNRLLWFALALAVVTYLDRVCISVAAPFVMRELGLSSLQMSFVFGAFTLAYSLFEIPTGWMGDVFGPRKILTRIVLWWSAFTALTAAAYSYAVLITIRFLFGAGEAGAFPNASRAFSRWFPPAERGRANGMLFLGSRLGGALAPPAALFIMIRWGWRSAFLIFGILGIFWAAAWHWWFRDDPADHPAVTVEELRHIRQGANEAPPASAQIVSWAAMFRSPNLYAICAMYFSFGYGLYFGLTWLPTYLIRELGFSSLSGGFFAGLPFLLAGGADVVGGWLTDRISQARGPRVGRCGLGFVSFSAAAGFFFLSTKSPDRVWTAVLIALGIASADLALGAAWALCLDVGHQWAGVVTGAMNTAGNLGGFIGPVVVGYAVDRWQSWTIPFHISAAVYACGALAWLLIDPHKSLMSRER